MKFNNVPMLSFAEVAQLIASVGPLRTVLVEGENGIGKSTLLRQLKAMPQFMNYLFPKPVDCAQLDVGDHLVPAPDFERGVTRGLPNERYGVCETNQKGVNGSKPVVIMLDEMAKAPKHVQASLAPLFFDRRVGSYELPEGSIVFGTTNLSTEGLGDFMPAHTRNRITIVRMRKPTFEEWKQNYAIPRGLSAEVIAFGEDHPFVFDSFIDYETNGKYANKEGGVAKNNPYIFNPHVVQDAYATPRSLDAASDLIKTTMNMSPDIVLASLAGTVGAATANQMDTYIRFGRQLESFERIIKEPETCPLPESAVAQIVLVFKLVTSTENRQQAEQVMKYVKRMKDEMSSLFCYTTATNQDKVSKFASLTLFQEMLKAHRIFFAAGDK